MSTPDATKQLVGILALSFAYVIGIPTSIFGFSRFNEGRTKRRHVIVRTHDVHTFYVVISILIFSVGVTGLILGTLWIPTVAQYAQIGNEVLIICFLYSLLVRLVSFMSQYTFAAACIKAIDTKYFISEQTHGKTWRVPHRYGLRTLLFITNTPRRSFTALAIFVFLFVVVRLFTLMVPILESLSFIITPGIVGVLFAIVLFLCAMICTFRDSFSLKNELLISSALSLFGCILEMCFFYQFLIPAFRWNFAVFLFVFGYGACFFAISLMSTLYVTRLDKQMNMPDAEFEMSVTHSTMLKTRKSRKTTEETTKDPRTAMGLPAVFSHSPSVERTQNTTGFDLHMCLGNPKSLRQFMTFLVEEMSVAELLFIIQVMQYKRIIFLERRTDKVLHSGWLVNFPNNLAEPDFFESPHLGQRLYSLFQTYLRTHSPLPLLNISKRTRKEISKFVIAALPQHQNTNIMDTILEDENALTVPVHPDRARLETVVSFRNVQGVAIDEKESTPEPRRMYSSEREMLEDLEKTLGESQHLSEYVQIFDELCIRTIFPRLEKAFDRFCSDTHHALRLYDVFSGKTSTRSAMAQSVNNSMWRDVIKIPTVILALDLFATIEEEDLDTDGSRTTTRKPQTPLTHGPSSKPKSLFDDETTTTSPPDSEYVSSGGSAPSNIIAYQVGTGHMSSTTAGNLLNSLQMNGDYDDTSGLPTLNLMSSEPPDRPRVVQFADDEVDESTPMEDQVDFNYMKSDTFNESLGSALRPNHNRFASPSTSDFDMAY